MSTFVSSQFQYSDEISINVAGSLEDVKIFLGLGRRGDAALPIVVTTADDRPVGPSDAFQQQLTAARVFLTDLDPNAQPANVQIGVIRLDSNMLPFLDMLPPDLQDYLRTMKPGKNAADEPVLLSPEVILREQKRLGSFLSPQMRLRGERSVVKEYIQPYLSRFQNPLRSRYPQIRPIPGFGSERVSVRAAPEDNPNLLSVCIAESTEQCHRFEIQGETQEHSLHFWCFLFARTRPQLAITIHGGGAHFTVRPDGSRVPLLDNLWLDHNHFPPASPFQRSLVGVRANAAIGIQVTGGWCSYEFGKACMGIGEIL